MMTRRVFARFGQRMPPLARPAKVKIDYLQSPAATKPDDSAGAALASTASFTAAISALNVSAQPALCRRSIFTAARYWRS